ASSRLIKSCIVLLFYLPAFDAPARAQGADTLYADRANLASARRAVEIWTADLARDPRDFEAAWKIARADYWIGGARPPGRTPPGVRAGHRGGTQSDRPPAGPGRGTLLGRREHGRDGGILRHAPRHEVPRTDQGRAPDGAADRRRVSGRFGGPRARPLVLQ